MKKLLDDLAAAGKTIERLRKAESRRKKDQQTLEEITYALKERVKELNCLYSISRIVEKYGDDLPMVLQSTVDIIPDAWQYPEITCCRISIENEVYQSLNFQLTPWKMSRVIALNARTVGSIDVIYLEEKPEAFEGPFLSEERRLVNMIAERIEKLIDRKAAEKALLRSETKTTALLNAIPDLMFQINGKGTLVGLHAGTFGIIRNLEERLIGKDIQCLVDEDDLLPKRLVDRTMISVKRALETGNPQVFEQHTTMTGRGRDYEVRMVVCGEDEVLGIVRDITRRKRLEREILEISNREQRRIGQDLHDSLCQHLAGIGFMSKVLEKKISSRTPVELGDVREIVELIDQAITLTKGYARGLNPVELLAEGLMIALSKLAENVRRLFGVSCVFSCAEPIYIYDNEMSTHLYRIAQEAINNAIKHGKAEKISISMERNGPQVLLSVSDNGLGVGNTKQTGKGMGLNIMRYRASMFGATLDLKPGEQGGAELVCTFQLPEGP